MKMYTTTSWSLTWLIGGIPAFLILPFVVGFYTSFYGLMVMELLAVLAWVGTLVYALWNEGWRPLEEERA